ncbi:NAD-glutamate dehydrogenase [Parendozoicomonas haliclonae]|uniref:NAD-specific glutamate dehydrogenase n=1 Tax=Parendozoicomonas haliclonae TaxID=1960125 RepID=A0A1X7AMM5_9GAMM|nr:NAD-glutamate dehydrogenase [Parendozoicomonas haliclonae]SMA49246.1 NAD-specific glutamate dehydrogenase [Parendozoicomonas haliclonae]
MYSQDEFLSKLEKELSKHLPDEQRAGLQAFLKPFFAISTLDEITAYRRRDLVGSTLAFWRFFQTHDHTSPKIEVFNPDYENNGWHSTHTIIQIVQQDMPFIVDSVRMKLNERGITIHHLRNCVLPVARDNKNQLAEAGEGGAKEALLYVEVDRQTDEEDLELLRQELADVLSDVRRVVTDYRPICRKVEELLASLEARKDQDTSEVCEYLRWLLSNNFTFLAYEELAIDCSKKGEPCVRQVEGERLGLLRPRHSGQLNRMNLEPELDRNLFADQSQLSFAKASVRSSVHRPAYPEFILIKRFDDEGKVIGECRIMGLYTSPVYFQSPRTIPWLRNKVSAILEMSGLDIHCHHGKELVQILDVYPREELFLTPTEQLFTTVMSILQIQERNQTRVFIRRDHSDLCCSALVYVPREQYDTALRIKMQNILCQRLNAVDAEFTTYFSESTLTRVHYILRREDNSTTDFDPEAIAAEIQQAAYSWEAEFRDALLEGKGEGDGNAILKTFRDSFPVSYRDAFSPPTAVADIEHMYGLTAEQPLSMSFYQPIDDDGHLHFKVFHYGSTLPLSDLIPIMENLGLKVLGEHPYKIRLSGNRAGEKICLHDFTLSLTDGQQLPLRKVADKFREAFKRSWYKQAENDRFNRLVMTAGLDWRQVTMLRAYAKYMKQIRFGFSQAYIASTLTKNIDITLQLVKLFEVSFDPDMDLTVEQRQARRQQLQQKIIEALEEVSVLSQDRILRRIMDLIVATLRTNFYQQDADGQPHDYISFKFSPRDIPDLPKPAPMYEIFVYSPYVEGVHLRGGKVARGGLRWSDRVEDFRTEVLGLVKAQQVKNAVIVPVGAKGGFVPKRLPANGTREQVMEEGIRCYKTFIRALLDVTDNLVDNVVVHPERVVRYDADDTYLVVAADKGTATFSDIANGIAEDYGFWLGDAFASGGSVGYDHKKMGITARGAWVSVQRHFRERGIDVQKEPITVVGIGDMAGDVFGNGLLSSEALKLVAAFNHMHIFVDPDPDPATSFAERERLFKLPRSSWEDYNSKLISEGGGIFNRSAKSITISAEMKKLFGIRASKLTPNDLISAILRSQVDLIWNGGIGTYVKSSAESHADVGDKANDTLRIDGRALRAKVIGEGGNLGLTQLGRIEYTLNGGAMNTDFIDNAGGVDCSDHEVNIKILLNQIVAAGDMTRKQRDRMLAAMTDDVARLVLGNNYRQTQAITMAESECLSQMEEYKGFIHDLEERGRLDRAIEFLPDDETIRERHAGGQGLTRPELSVLISYSKADLKEKLLDSAIPDDAYLARELVTAFPAQLVKKYGEPLAEHRLHREIVATQLSNYLINMMGITFVSRQQKSTGASAPDIVRGFVIARDIFGAEQLWSDIESLDYTIDSKLQLELMGEVMRILRRATRWLVRMKVVDRETGVCVEHYKGRITQLIDGLDDLLPERQRKEWLKRVEQLTGKGVPEPVARRVAAVRHLFNMLPVIQAVEETGQSLERVASMFFAIGEHLDLHGFYQQLSALDVQNQWQSLAREGIRDELVMQQRTLTVNLLTLPDAPKDLGELFTFWSEAQAAPLARWHSVLDELRGEAASEFAMYTVATRELLDLAQRR